MKKAKGKRLEVKRKKLEVKKPKVKGGFPFIILTGLSGSGKSHAIRALEDLGYFCVDNLPMTLMPTMAKLSVRRDIEKVAVVVDVREGNFLSSFPRILKRLRQMRGLNPVLIFLEASNSALLRRFSETRRPHPMARDRSPSEGIRDERAHMAAIRAMAAFIEREASTREFISRLEDYTKYVVPFYVAEGKSYLTVAIGCTGGRHRSVMIAERLRRALSSMSGVRVRVRHRDIAHV